MAEITDNSVEILGQDLIEVAIDPAPVIEIDVEPAPVIEIEVFPGGIILQQGEGSLSLQYQLILSRLTSQPQLYRELTYTGGNLTAIDAWSTSAKVLKIFETRFTYTGENLTRKVLTDVQAGTILTVTYGYTGSDLTSINEIFS
jgi:hypothetical protein